jgi:hypothetical protein
MGGCFNVLQAVYAAQNVKILTLKDFLINLCGDGHGCALNGLTKFTENIVLVFPSSLSLPVARFDEVHCTQSEVYLSI